MTHCVDSEQHEYCINTQYHIQKKLSSIFYILFLPSFVVVVILFIYSFGVWDFVDKRSGERERELTPFAILFHPGGESMKPHRVRNFWRDEMTVEKKKEKLLGGGGGIGVVVAEINQAQNWLYLFFLFSFLPLFRCLYHLSLSLFICAQSNIYHIHRV